jgi:hypothetical protein
MITQEINRPSVQFHGIAYVDYGGLEKALKTTGYGFCTDTA